MSSNNTYTITEQQRSNFKPTYLYIKQHSITGLKYLGKTTNKNPKKYTGSGVHWKRHIKKHGKRIETLWVYLFTDIDKLVATALTLSEIFDIVESDSWSNLILENGLDGTPVGTVLSEESKQKISNATKGVNNPFYGKIHTEETKLKMSKIHKNKTLSQEHKQKLIQTNTGRICSNDTRSKISNKLMGRIISEESINKRAKTYIVIDPDGISYTILNISKFCREHNLCRQNMVKVADGQRLHHKHWKCKYPD